MPTYSPVGIVNITETGFLRTIAGRRKFVSCTECANLMGVGWAMPQASTRSTAALIRLYNAGKHDANGGSTPNFIVAAVLSQFKHKPTALTSFADALAALRAGAVLAVPGDMGRLGTHFIRWDPRFARGGAAWHDIAVGPIAIGDTSDDPWVWWRDPLGKGSTYKGEWAQWSMVMKFAFNPKTYNILAYLHNAWQ